MGWRKVGAGSKAGGAGSPAVQLDAMKNDTSRILFAYWNEVRGHRPAPRRFEIEPARIAPILPDAFILERIDHQTFKFRIAGTRLCEQFGRELRGINILDQWDEEDRFILRQRLATIAEQAAVGLFEYEAFGSTSDGVRFEMIVLPLVQRDSTIDRFLGAASFEHIGAHFEMEHLDRRHLLRHELIWPESSPSRANKFARRTLPDIRDAKLVRINQRSFRVYEGGLSRRSSDKR